MRTITGVPLDVALSGILRHPLRALLTVLSVAAAFALFGVLQGADDSFEVAIADLQSAATRLTVQSRISRTDPLPISHLAEIEKVPGVVAAVQVGMLLGFFQDQKNWVNGFAVDMDREFAVFSHYQVPPDALARMREQRTGAIIGATIAKKYGWKVGDRVPLISQVFQRSDGTYNWAFDVVGIYDTPDHKSTEAFFIRYDYFDEERVAGKGTVANFAVRVADAKQAQSVARQVDARFANSSDETLTQSGRDALFNRIRQLGDVKLMVRSVLAATLILVVFVIANVIRQSAEERLGEFGILQSLGFGSWNVSALVFAEALCLAAAGALIGLGASTYLIGAIPQQFGKFEIHAVTVIKAAVVMGVIAFAGAFLPAWKVKVLPVVEALRRQ